MVWRELPAGGIEVAIRRERLVKRMRVHDDGNTSHVGSVPMRCWPRWSASPRITRA